MDYYQGEEVSEKLKETIHDQGHDMLEWVDMDYEFASDAFSLNILSLGEKLGETIGFNTLET